MRERKSYVGEYFGRLIIIADAPDYLSGKKDRRMVLCRCDCGNGHITSLDSLKRGLAISCGCYQKEKLANEKLKHGQNRRGARTKEYSAWASMIARCLNENIPATFRNYKGRGITVCDGYKKSFENLFADLGKKPTKKHSIDRIDNDLNYSCGKCEECIKNGWEMNVRWATKKIQTRNQRTNRWIEYNGRNMILTDWATELNLDKRSLWSYLKRNSFDKIFKRFYKDQTTEQRKNSLIAP